MISDLETGENTNPSWDVLSRRLMDVADEMLQPHETVGLHAVAR